MTQDERGELLDTIKRIKGERDRWKARAKALEREWAWLARTEML